MKQQQLFDLEAEERLLGAALLLPSVVIEAAGIVRPSDFWKEDHAALFAALTGSANGDLDPATLARIADPLWRGQLQDHADLVTTHQDAERIADLARSRYWADGAARLSQAAYNVGGDPAELARELLQADRARHGGGSSSWAALNSLLAETSWAWPSWLPNGFLTLAVGEQESGKSALALRVAASYLDARPWPNKDPFEGEVGTICWAEAEAGQALNRDRAAAWGLPCDRVLSPLADPLADFRLDNKDHLRALEAVAHDPTTRLIVLDSLSGAHGRRENDAEMLRVIKQLAELARDTGKPVLLTHHLRKRGILDLDDKITLDRIRGSGVISQTARAVWAIDIPDPNQPDRRRLSLVKCNLSGNRPEPLGFTIADGGLTFGTAPETPKKETQLDRACDLLRTLLDDGPMTQRDIEAESKGAAIGWRTVERAKDTLGIVVSRVSGCWLWALPAKREY